MLRIKETYINETRGYRYGDSGWYEPFTDDMGKLFHSLQREYGRCTGKVYVDTKEGKTKGVGWVFRKRVTYDDCKDTYLREVWIVTRTISEEEQEL